MIEDTKLTNAKDRPTGLPAASRSGRLGVLTDVETELRKMQCQLANAGVVDGAKVLGLAADIVAMSGRQAVALRDATTLIGEIMCDEVNAQDECEKWLRAYGPNASDQ